MPGADDGASDLDSSTAMDGADSRAPGTKTDAAVVFCSSPEAGPGPEAGCGSISLPNLLPTDPHNCGACGVGCDGGACSSGACVPLPAQTLVTGLLQPVSIAVDATSVYWLDLGDTSGGGGKLGYEWINGRVMKCAVTGCGNTPTLLAAGWAHGGGLPAPPGSLAIDALNVYWAGAGVMSCALSGCDCQPNPFGGLGGGASGVTSAAGSVYWTEYDVAEVGRCPPNGCRTASPFAKTTGGPLGIVHDVSTLYWISVNGDLFSCPVSGCPASGPTLLMTPTAAGSEALAVDDQNIYWTNGNPAGYGSVMQCAKASCGTTVTVLASGRSSPMGIAVDATDVYWVESGIYKCAIGGCGGTPTRVAPGLVAGNAIALDASHIYVVASPPSASPGYVGASIVVLPK
jgi:hypothetical protein